MSSTITKSAGVATEPVDLELEAVLEISEDAFVLYEASGGIRYASNRLHLLLDLGENEWESLRDFSSISRILDRRLIGGHDCLRPPWLLWRPGNGAGRERLEVGPGGRIIERTARPILGDLAEPSDWVERYRDLTSSSDRRRVFSRPTSWPRLARWSPASPTS